MAEDLQITEGSKEEKYQSLIPQIKGLVDGETDVTANLANICAALKSTFHFFWVGFYQVKRAGAGTVSGSGGLYPYPIRKRGVRHCLERGCYTAGSRCGCFSRSHSLQLAFAIGDCCSRYG